MPLVADGGVEVVDGDPVFAHDGHGGIIELPGAVLGDDNLDLPLRADARRSGGGEDQFGARLLELGDDALQTGSVGFRGDFRLLPPAIPVPEAEVEVDDVPLRVNRPSPST